MTPEQFCYWLQGYFELSGDTDRLPQREHIIRDHLATVFKKETPQYYRTTENPEWRKMEIGDDLNAPKIIC